MKRIEYKWLVGIVFAFGMFMNLLDTTIVNVALPTFAREFNASATTIEWVVTAYLLALAVFIPSILVDIKRWHDRDKSGWWMLILLVPIIGAIWFLIELGFLAGTPGPNRFGAPAAD